MLSRTVRWLILAAVSAAACRRSDDRRRIDDAKADAERGRSLFARQLGSVLGRNPEANERQHRHADDQEHHLRGWVLRHRQARAHGYAPLHLDARQPGRAARYERLSGSGARRQVQASEHRPRRARHVQRVCRGRGGDSHEQLHAGLFTRCPSGLPAVAPPVISF